MDGRGRIAESLSFFARLRARLPTGGARTRADACVVQPEPTLPPPTHFQWLMHRGWFRLMRMRIPRGAGIAAAIVIVLAGLGYGAVRGDHVVEFVEGLKDVRDQAANAVGFRVVSVAVTGHHHVSREEVLATANVTGRSSLLFLSVAGIRERLKTNPWIADATVLKLYPGELQIGIKEREPFALWQKDRRVSVIADDGTVLETYAVPQLFKLPLVVGRGAETQAKDFLAVLDRFPAIRDGVRASILVGERRWNLRMRSGLDIRLPEAGAAEALERLVELDRAHKLLSRDIVAIDLRLPDRVTVRQSEKGAQARQDQLKDAVKKGKKGGRA
jgi:cell division protein FtsQ